MSDPIQDIARQLGIQTFGDGLLAKIGQTIDLLRDAAQERDHLRAELTALKAQQAEPLPLFTCIGKGGQYANLGYAKPAGAIKTIQGESGLMVYMDTATKQLYFRDPKDFHQRMAPLGTVEPCSLGGDLIRQMTTADIAPQPAPAQDVAEKDALLREFLDVCTGGFADDDHVRRLRLRLEALAAHDKQSGGEA